MPKERLSIARWQEAVAESPERVADRLLGELELATVETRRALFAAIPERGRLIENLQFALSQGDGPLRGVPYMLQDLFDVRGLPTACGAPFAEPFEAPLEESCLLYQELKGRGAAFCGKTVPAEFGVSTLGRNPTFGDCPHATGSHKVGGGGAGPSVRAVDDGWVPLAFGMDATGGMRVPTAFHGLFGYRMAPNDYARDGVFPVVPSMDAAGWVTGSLADLRRVFDAFHPRKSERAANAPRGLLLQDDARLLDREVKAGLLRVIRPLDVEDDHASARELLSLLDRAEATLRLVRARELYALHQYWIEEYRERYDHELRRIIETGGECKPAEAEACDADRQLIRGAILKLFEDFDFLVLPVSPQATPRRRKWSHPLESEILRLVAPASLALLPALTLPFACGSADFGAVQVLINPKRIDAVSGIFDQVEAVYAKGLPAAL